MCSIVLFAIVILTAIVKTISACEPGSFYSQSNRTCQQCPPGTFQQHSGVDVCQPCPAATFMPNSGATRCWTCPKNAVPLPGNVRCECLPGTIWNFSSKTCEFCPLGTFPRYGICKPCQKDFFISDPSQARCLPCPSGSFAPKGSTECVTCPTNQAPLFTDRSRQKLSCGTCPPGQGYNSRSRNCEICGLDYFGKGDNTEPCVPCPKNSFPNPNHDACVSCPPGTRLLEGTRCGTCPPGTYFATFAKACYDCQENFYTDRPNIRTSCCKCPRNTFAGKRAAKCITCPTGQVLLQNGSCASCPPGFKHRPTALDCVSCRVNQIAPLGTNECKNCEVGTFAKPGSSECFKCDGDQVYLVEEDKCGTCPPGTAYNQVFGGCPRCRSSSNCRPCAESSIFNCIPFLIPPPSDALSDPVCEYP